MSVYADSSFFVSFYLQDSHAARVSEWMASHPSVFLTGFQRVELVHAVYQHVFRKLISESEAKRVFGHYEEDRSGGLWREADTPARQYERAIELAHKYVAKLGVRTQDTLHVAAALELGASVFWSFDERQLGLARAVGLATN